MSAKYDNGKIYFTPSKNSYELTLPTNSSTITLGIKHSIYNYLFHLQFNKTVVTFNIFSKVTPVTLVATVNNITTTASNKWIWQSDSTIQLAHNTELSVQIGWALMTLLEINLSESGSWTTTIMCDGYNTEKAFAETGEPPSIINTLKYTYTQNKTDMRTLLAFYFTSDTTAAGTSHIEMSSNVSITGLANSFISCSNLGEA